MIESRLSAARAQEVGRIVSDLRTRFVRHEGFKQLQEQFDLLLYRRRADLDAGRQAEARGILIVGNSGAGKSTAIQRLFASHSDLRRPNPDLPEADVISFVVPSPATLKSVAFGCLQSLGYPIQRERTAAVMWGHVQHLLSERQVLFLHLDEVQHLHASKGATEARSVINTLKSLMQHQMWPTGLILSGTDELRALVNLDPQLSRRLAPIEFGPLDVGAQRASVRKILQQYAKAVGMPPNPDILADAFLRRLIHAAAYELGIAIELIISGFEEALILGSDELDTEAFRLAFERRSGCRDMGNPFVAEDWKAIDARKLMMEGPSALRNIDGYDGRASA